MSVEDLITENNSNLPKSKDTEGNKTKVKKDANVIKRTVSEQMKLLFLIVMVIFVFTVLLFVSIFNPNLYSVDRDTHIVINEAFNALIVLVIPFILGVAGAVARILLTSVNTANQFSLVLSSGLMAAFSWIGIKSGVLLAIVAPHLERQGMSSAAVVDSQSNFYTMALVAVLVGVFSPNLYSYVNQKVGRLTRDSDQNNLDERG